MAGLHGPTVNRRPLQESNREAVLAAADLREQRAVSRQNDAQQSAVHVFLHAVLVHAIDGCLVCRLRALPDEPQNLDDSVAERPDRVDPARKILLAPLIRLPQPVVVFGQVEFTGAPGDRIAVLYGIQELAVLRGCRYLVPIADTWPRLSTRLCTSLSSRPVSTPGWLWNRCSAVIW